VIGSGPEEAGLLRYNPRAMSAKLSALGLSLLIAACANGAVGPLESGSRAESLVREADGRLVASDWEGAIAAYGQAIEADPEFAHAYSRLAYAQLFNPAFQAEAIEQASLATELASNSGEAWAYLGRALDWNGDFDEALVAAERAAELSPDEADVQSFLAEILADLRMYDEALVAAEKAVRFGPENAEAHRNLGYVYEFIGRREEALAEYLRAHELEAEFVYRHSSLAGYYLYEVDELQTGEQWLESAQALAPDDYITLLLLARVHSGRGELDQAIAYCERILESAPAASDGHDCLGGVYLDAGRYQDAEAERKAAIEADPENEAGYLGLGYVYYAQQDCQGALTQFTKAVELHPRTGTNHAAQGFAYACLRQWEQAEAAYRQAIELEPQEGDHHILLGRMYLDRGDPNRAEREFEIAIDLDPGNDQYVAWLGRLHSSQGELEQAVEVYERAAALDPDDASHELSIGFAYLGPGGDSSQAEPRFQRALDIYLEQGATSREIAQATYGLALVYLSRADCAGALPQLQEAVRLDSALTAARDYLLQCRRVAGFSGAGLPPDLAQRSQYAGRDALDALRLGLASVGIEARAEFRPGEGGENLLLLAHVAIGEPGSAEFLAQQSLVSFAGSRVAARLLVPTVDRLLVISLNADGDSIGLLEVRMPDARLWELGVLNDAQFTAFWRNLSP